MSNPVTDDRILAVNEGTLRLVLWMAAETMLFVKPNNNKHSVEPWVVMEGQGGDPPRARLVARYRERPEAVEACEQLRADWIERCLDQILAR